MSDIVERLMRFDGRKCVSSDVEVEAADLIERQREALRVTREALADYSCDCATTFPEGITECNGDFDVAWCGKRANTSLAAIDAVLNKTEGE